MMSLWLGAPPSNQMRPIVASLLLTSTLAGAVALSYSVGAFPSHPSSLDLLRLEFLAQHLSTTLFIIAMAISFALWLSLAAWAKAAVSPSVDGWAVKATILWALLCALSFPLYSQDVFYYMATGAVASAESDPYQGGPAQVLPNDHPMMHIAADAWANVSNQYGPAFTIVQELIDRLLGESVLISLLGYRAVSLAAFAILVHSTVTLTRAHNPKRVNLAFWIVAMNPLVLLHSISGMHNDVIVMALVTLAFSKITPYRTITLRLALTVTILGTLAGMIKLTGLFFAPFLLIAIITGVSQLTERVRLLAICTLTFSVTAGIVVTLSGAGPKFILGLGAPTQTLGWTSPPTFIGLAISKLATRLGFMTVADYAVPFARVACLALCAALVAWLLFLQLRKRLSFMDATALSTLALLLSFPTLHPWYLLWAIPFAAACSSRFPTLKVSPIRTTGILSGFLLFAVYPQGSGFPVFESQSGTVSQICAALGLVCSWLALRSRKPRLSDIHPIQKTTTLEAN